MGYLLAYPLGQKGEKLTPSTCVRINDSFFNMSQAHLSHPPVDLLISARLSRRQKTYIELPGEGGESALSID